MLQVEASYVGTPEELQIRIHPLRPAPPQPKHARLSAPLAARQSFDLYQDERPDRYGQEPSATLSFVVLDLRVQLRPRPHTHGSVPGVPACMFGGRLGP